ncbi:hypothetical protein YQE_04419, partial [Dendroctonus ponderosae]
NKWRLRRKEYAKSFKPASLKPFSLDYYKDSCDFIKEVKRQNGELVIAYDTFTKFQSDVARKLLNPLIPASLWLRFQAGGKIVARKVKELRSISFVANEETPALLDLMMSLKGGILSDEDIFDDLMFLSSAVRHKIIPKGANVVLSLFHLHRSEKYWEDPQKFDPDRFLPENVSKITPYSYLPFSSGPRDCLGMKMCLQKKYVTKISGPLYEASKFHPSTNPLTNLS